MKRHILWVIGFVLLGTASIWSQNYRAFPIGEFWQFGDARTLGLAGAGSVSLKGATALLHNPAALSRQRTRLSGNFSLRLQKLEERRSFPIYNRIDDITQNGTYAINNNYFPDVQGGLSYHFGQSPIPFLRTVAVGVYQEINQDYRYDEEVRKNIFGDSLLAYNTLKYEGTLLRYSLGTGWGVSPRLHFGLQVGFLKGDIHKRRSISFVRQPYRSILQRESHQLNNTPIVVSVGGIYDATPRLTIGTYFKFPYTLKYQLTLRNNDSPSTPFQETIEYPPMWNVGFEYRASQALQARLNMDFRYEWWSNARYQIENNPQNSSFKFEDAISLRAGIEHIFFNQIPFRVGVQYRTSYRDRKTTQTLLTAGTGFFDQWWQIDVAGGFSSLSYKFPDLFDDSLYGGNRSNSPIDDVKENYFFGLVTVKVFK